MMNFVAVPPRSHRIILGALRRHAMWQESQEAAQKTLRSLMKETKSDEMAFAYALVLEFLGDLRNGMRLPLASLIADRRLSRQPQNEENARLAEWLGDDK